jgi:glycosyltransferase involved in cell wall biosynthesis
LQTTNGTMPSFSVVIPTYDRPDLTRRAIQSCLAQTKPPLEIIVIDDHSPIPFEWNEGSIVKVARHERNFGGGRARNTGIDLSQGDFICFLDSDDLWIPDKLRDVERAILADPRGGETVYFHDLLMRRSGQEDRPLPNAEHDGAERILDYIFLKRGVVQTSTLVVPANAAKRIRFDDSLRIHQDWDFSHRLELGGLRFRRIPSALAVWSHGEGQQRVSRGRKIDQAMAWIGKLGDTISSDVRTAINYRVIVPRLRASHPLQAFGYVMKARQSGIIGTGQFIRDIVELPLAFLKGQLRRLVGAQ